jgi:trans-2,3-dihydro-3-hydroxyanthranilate isomerase
LSVPTLRYLHLDVFTDRPFEGNQLAVFPDPGDIDASTMQRIAKEMNFSESTFIFPKQGTGDIKMRIFTPGTELPMAGHPTIGSTFALAIEGAIAKGREQFVFELGVGPTPVSLEWDASGLTFAWMTQPSPTFGPAIGTREALASAIGVPTTDIVDGLPIQMVSCGVPFLIVPMTSRKAVDAVTIDRKAFSRCCQEAGIAREEGYFFTTERVAGSDATVYSRMLAPGFGISEDPATGSAAGPLGAYLVRYRVVSPDEGRGLLNLQGAAMGRPSRLSISIDSDEDRITRVRVGGQSVLVGRGELLI